MNCWKRPRLFVWLILMLALLGLGCLGRWERPAPERPYGWTEVPHRSYDLATVRNANPFRELSIRSGVIDRADLAKIVNRQSRVLRIALEQEKERAKLRALGP